MAKFISRTLDERGVATNHTYEAKNGRRFSARYAAVAMAMCDGHDDTATFREAMCLRRERAARVAVVQDSTS